MRTRLAHAEEGFTLVELLVVMLLLGIVGTVTVSGLVSAFRVQTHGEERVQATTALQNTLANVGREVRAADSGDSVAEAALRTASATALEFDTYRNEQRIRFTLTVATGGGTLTQRRRVWDDDEDPATVTPSSDATRVLVGNLVDAATTPVFAVRDSVGDCLTGCLSGGTLVTAALTDAQLRAAATVELRLLRDVGQGRPPIEVSTVIMLRNR